MYEQKCQNKKKKINKKFEDIKGVITRRNEYKVI